MATAWVVSHVVLLAGDRELQFPLERLCTGIGFESAKGEVWRPREALTSSQLWLYVQASYKSDKDRILSAIGSKTEELDHGIHGVVAAASLERVLRQGERHECGKHLEALRQGRVRHLRINLAGAGPDGSTQADTVKNLAGVLDALNPELCEALSICTRQVAIPAALNKLRVLVELNLEHCIGLKQLPTVSWFAALRELQLAGCTNLTRLADLPVTLEEVVVDGCVQLQYLAPNLSKLKLLRRLSADSCVSLVSLPDNLGTSLVQLNMRRCTSLKMLPSSVSDLASLTTLNLEGCKGLFALPENLCNLKQLTKLNLCHCNNLATLPDLSSIDGLKEVDTRASNNCEGVVYVCGLCSSLVRSWQGCGYAPGCKDGLAKGYGLYIFLFPWVKPEHCQSCTICKCRSKLSGVVTRLVNRRLSMAFAKWQLTAAEIKQRKFSADVLEVPQAGSRSEECFDALEQL